MPTSALAFGEMASLGKQQRREVDHIFFRISEAIRRSFMSLDIVVGLSCKWESKLMVIENFATGREQRGHLLSREPRSFKEIMKNGHQSERTWGLAPLELHCQCFPILLC